LCLLLAAEWSAQDFAFYSSCSFVCLGPFSSCDNITMHCTYGSNIPCGKGRKFMSVVACFQRFLKKLKSFLESFFILNAFDVFSDKNRRLCRTEQQICYLLKLQKNFQHTLKVSVCLKLLEVETMTFYFVNFPKLFLNFLFEFSFKLCHFSACLH
jgi:hypothetical protein